MLLSTVLFLSFAISIESANSAGNAAVQQVTDIDTPMGVNNNNNNNNNHNSNTINNDNNLFGR